MLEIVLYVFQGLTNYPKPNTTTREEVLICIILRPSSLSSSPSIICIELDTRFSNLLISPFLTIAFAMKSTHYNKNQNQTCNNQYCLLFNANEPREYSWKLPFIPIMSNN